MDNFLTLDKRIQKQKWVMVLAMGLFLIFSYLGIDTVYALETPASVVLNTDNTDNVTTESDDGSINNLEVTMGEDGTIKTNFDNNKTKSDTWSRIFNEYKVIIVGVSGVLTLTFVLFFLKNIAGVAANAENPVKRKDAITACIWTGIAAAFCGSILTVTGLFWNAFK